MFQATLTREQVDLEITGRLICGSRSHIRDCNSFNVVEASRIGSIIGSNPSRVVSLLITDRVSKIDQLF